MQLAGNRPNLLSWRGGGCRNVFNTRWVSCTKCNLSAVDCGFVFVATLNEIVCRDKNPLSHPVEALKDCHPSGLSSRRNFFIFALNHFPPAFKPIFLKESTKITQSYDANLDVSDSFTSPLPTTGGRRRGRGLWTPSFEVRWGILDTCFFCRVGEGVLWTPSFEPGGTAFYFPTFFFEKD